MTRRILSYFLTTVFALAFTACSSRDFDGPDDSDLEEGTITLYFRCAKPASRAADNTHNEDKISSLSVFLYPADADDDTTEPIITQSYNFTDSTQSTQVKISLNKKQTDQLFGANAADNATCRLVALANLPAGATLPEKLTVSALRNISITARFASQQGNQDQANFTMFGDTNEERSGNQAVTYKTAATSGKIGGTATGNVMLVRAAARIMLNVQLPDTVHTFEQTGEGTRTVVWKPLPEMMQVILTNGVKSSVTDPSILTTKPAEDAYFSLEEGSITGTNADAFMFANNGATGENAFPWSMTRPFYTFPNQWEVSASESYRTTMTLVVPWTREDRPDNYYRTCYYKMPVTGGTELLRNTSYTVNLIVSMLGSFSYDEPLQVEPSYFAVDWSEVPTGVNIKDYRYLVVNRNNFTVNNQETIQIPYFSSHDVEVTNVTMTYQRFNMYGNDGDIMEITIDDTQNEATKTKNYGVGLYSYQLTTDASGSPVLEISHPLTLWKPYKANGSEVKQTGNANKAAAEAEIADISYYEPVPNDNAYSPYVIHATLKHTDQVSGTAFEQRITVTQYPGMWINAEKNEGGNRYVDEENWEDEEKGFVFVNGSQQGYVYQNGDWIIPTNSYGGIFGLNNTIPNPNMYIITINTLSSNQQDYVIDDPRYYLRINLSDNYRGTAANPTYYLTGTSHLYDPIIAPQLSDNNYINNLQGVADWSTNAPATNYAEAGQTSRRLTWYYPTNESESFGNVVAPKIRIASSYGISGSLTMNNARRRCASYQEAGYPAGRWRLPTLGELQFIVNLSYSGKIPTLFSPQHRYWTAQGSVLIPGSDSENTTLEAVRSSDPFTVRCVYDEWYWEAFTNTVNKATFTWGDRYKENPENIN